MLARLQQCVTLGLLLASLAWVTWGLKRGSPGLAVIGPVAIVVGYACVMAVEFVLLWWVSRREPTGRARPLQLINAWAGEIVTAPRVFCWRQPFRSNTFPDNLPQHSTLRRGVVFVHGFVCNRGLWNPWLPRLRQAGVPFVAVDLEPVFGAIDTYSAIIDDAVLRITKATRLAPVVVAHSMGGLAVRAWFDAYAADDRVHRVITIATPHHGTFMALFSIIGGNTRQMRLDNPWLCAMAQRESAARFARFTCFHGNCDNIVFPVASATLPGADNRHLPECAHVRMAEHEAVYSEILRCVGAPPTPTPTPSAEQRAP